MKLTITLPEHVAAAFDSVEEAQAFCLHAASEKAKAHALSEASAQAQELFAAAAAPFDNAQ